MAGVEAAWRTDLHLDFRVPKNSGSGERLDGLEEKHRGPGISDRRQNEAERCAGALIMVDLEDSARSPKPLDQCREFTPCGEAVELQSHGQQAVHHTPTAKR